MSSLPPGFHEGRSYHIACHAASFTPPPPPLLCFFARAWRTRNRHQVFQWFEADFTTKAGNASVLDALLPYMPEDARPYVSENKSTLKVEHFEYDWGLNGPSPGAAGKNGKC